VRTPDVLDDGLAEVAVTTPDPTLRVPPTGDPPRKQPEGE